MRTPTELQVPTEIPLPHPALLAGTKEPRSSLAITQFQIQQTRARYRVDPTLVLPSHAPKTKLLVSQGRSHSHSLPKTNWRRAGGWTSPDSHKHNERNEFVCKTDALAGDTIGSESSDTGKLKKTDTSLDRADEGGAYDEPDGELSEVDGGKGGDASLVEECSAARVVRHQKCQTTSISLRPCCVLDITRSAERRSLHVNFGRTHLELSRGSIALLAL